MRRVARTVFGARAQVAIGAACFALGAAWWVYIEARYPSQLSRQPLVAAIFRVSMFFGLAACYAIVATGLGYRATERVEAKVVKEVDVG